MDDADIRIGVEISVFKACAISINSSCPVATDTSQVGINEQAADKCGVFMWNTGFLKAGGGKIEKSFFVYVNKGFWWSVHVFSLPWL
jgi:hypothetical protein